MHIEIDYHPIKKTIQNKLIKTQFLGTKDQQSDIMAMRLGGPKHD